MPSVEFRVDIGGFDWLPHSFILHPAVERME